MAAVLHRPPQLTPEGHPCPPDRGPVTVCGRGERVVAKFARGLVDADEGVAALVHISTDDNHEGCLLLRRGTVGPVGGHISVGAVPRSYQVTPAGPSHRPPAKPHKANPEGRQARNEPDDRREGPNHRTSGPVTLTLRARRTTVV